MTRMRGLISLLCLLCLFSSLSFGQSTSVPLTGTLLGPNGVGVTGTLVLKLTKGGVKNICTPPPFQVVPNTASTYQLQNGTIVNGGSALFTVTDCLSPRVPYYIEVYDAQNHLIYGDNWYIKPPNGATSMDVGLLSSTGFAGPITLSVPQAIVWNPTGNQTITQPVGTSLSVNNLTVTNSFTYSGPNPFSLGNVTINNLTVSNSTNF